MPQDPARLMSGFRRASEWLGLAGAVLAMSLHSAAAEMPQRVVSMNICTDQLALMLAAPGQLVSVSFLAHDPAYSPLAEAARALPANRGTAEDIVLLQPDLVLAGRFTTSATVAMLQRLEIPVIRFASENSLDDVERALRVMGDALRREDKASAIIEQFRADRAALEARIAPFARESAALYFARGYTSGRQSLASDILDAAGLDNLASDLGFEFGGQLALETLVLNNPDRLILDRRSAAGWSEAQALLDHPALRSMPAYTRGLGMSDADWVCGTPHVLGAVLRLIKAREATP